ncbi:MAG: TadG family pilus assembly protein [Herbaspirillum sp.]
MKHRSSFPVSGLPVRHRQQGSIVVLTAVFIPLMIILLASIDIGYLFFQKRELQKVADMSAIAGAQQLSKSGALPNDRCASVYQVATANAQSAQKFTGTMAVSCGNWDPVANAAPQYYLAYAGGVTPAGKPQPNAVSVQLTRSFGSFFGAWAAQQVSASAIAKSSSSTPNAVFSIGSRLLQVNNGVVPGLLSALGVNISGSSLLSYNGLANVSMTPSGLLNALGFQIPLTADVGTIKQAVLLNTSGCSNGACTLETVLGAMSTVLGQQNLISALGLQASGGQLVQILSDGSGRGGLFTLVDTANGQAALQADVNALQLLTTAIGVANGHRFGSLGLAVSVPGLVNNTIQAGIVEPPSIGIGGVGATAYTAQVRLYSEIKTVISPLLGVDLPLVIDVVNGLGTITDMCHIKDSAGNDTATIAVSAPLLEACVGGITSGAAFSTTGSCDSQLQPATLVNVLGLLKLNTRVVIPALPNTGSVTLSKGQTLTIGGNVLQIGTTVSNLFRAVLADILGQLLGQGQGGVTPGTLATMLLNPTGNVLEPLAKALADLNTLLINLQGFANGLNDGSPLASIGNLVGGLLNSVTGLLGNLLGDVVCRVSSLGSPTYTATYNQCALAKQLSGGNGTVPNVLLVLLGLVQYVLAPLLDQVGAALSSALGSLLGLDLGQVDVTLIDLNCGSGAGVDLVY